MRNREKIKQLLISYFDEKIKHQGMILLTEENVSRTIKVAIDTIYDADKKAYEINEPIIPSQCQGK